MSATFGIVKRAWIRTPGQPIGRPGTGRISCPCGSAPETKFHPDTGNIACPCGTVYTWDGHIVQAAPASQEAP